MDFFLQDVNWKMLNKGGDFSRLYPKIKKLCVMKDYGHYNFGS